MVSLASAAGYGAVGGLVFDCARLWHWLSGWQEARHEARTAHKPLPPLTDFIDARSDISVAVTRALLGCVAGALLRGEVSGIYPLLTVGASAPAVLLGLGRVAKLGPSSEPSGKDV